MIYIVADKMHIFALNNNNSLYYQYQYIDLFIFDFGYPVLGSYSFLSLKGLINSTFQSFHIVVEPTW